MSQGGRTAVKADEDVVVSSRVRELEAGSATLNACSAARHWNRSAERGTGRRAGEKTELAVAVATTGRFPVKVVAKTLGVARSNLIERMQGATKPRGPYRRQGDDDLLQAIRQLTDARPTYGYRRITALLNRARRA